MKKGFTLIELLAVIVILAIIAVIASPIIVGIIDDSRLKGKENSVNGLMEAVKVAYTKSNLTTTPLSLPITATINNGLITATDGTNSIIVEYSGEKPISGKILMNNFEQLLALNIKYNDNYICSMGLGEHGCTNSKFNVPIGTYVKNDISPHDTERLVYYGNADNNYIILNENNVEKIYRIVSIESDGTLKVIRQGSIDNKPYDTNITGDNTAVIGKRLNNGNTYCQKWNGTSYTNDSGVYLGCNAWNKVSNIYTNGDFSGTVSEDATLNTYLNTEFYSLLDDNVKNNIVTHQFNVTTNYWNEGLSTLNSLTNATNIWIGKIGLLELRDYFNASGDNNCVSTATGSGWYDGSGVDTTYECSQKNYLYLSGQYWWTISSSKSTRYSIFRINSAGAASMDDSCYSFGVRPVFYLSANTKLSGNGTIGNEYRIKS